jgi:hypothetical protein
MDAYLQEGRLDERIAALADRFYGVVDVEQLRASGRHGRRSAAASRADG